MVGGSETDLAVKREEAERRGKGLVPCREGERQRDTNERVGSVSRRWDAEVRWREERLTGENGMRRGEVPALGL